jgi:hypothetical protein
VVNVLSRNRGDSARSARDSIPANAVAWLLSEADRQRISQLPPVIAPDCAASRRRSTA